MSAAGCRESKRKTPNVVSIHRGERTFGNDALNTAVKYPKHAYRYLVELLGQTVKAEAAPFLCHGCSRDSACAAPAASWTALW